MEISGAQALSQLLATLQAVHLTYWTSHWFARGHGDHLLFDRLYNALPDEIDPLAEKIVGIYGEEWVSASPRAALTARLMAEWAKETDPILQGLHMEEYLQRMFRHVRDILEDLGELTLGLDDYLTATASAHETNQYLLGQRARSRLASTKRNPC